MTKSFAAKALRVFALVTLASCFGESTGLDLGYARLSIVPQFDRQGLHAVDVNRVRVLITRLGGSPVLADTIVAFPAAQDTLDLSLAVAIQGSQEDLELSLFMLDDPGGVVVFQSGPDVFTAVAGSSGSSNPVTPVPLYVGTGSNAVGVRFLTTAPTVSFGDSVLFTAEAFGANNAAIPGTPIVWRSSDTTRAIVRSDTIGRYIARQVRGPVTATASLLQTSLTTPPAFVASPLLVQPLPSAIVIQSGGGQSGTVGQALALPVRVRVNAADNLGVEGVRVNFAVTSGGGSLSAVADTTDAQGDATVLWTLGTPSGAQTISATVASLPAATIPVPATGVAGPATQLAFTSVPAGVTAGAPITPAIQVTARDQFGNTAASFTGNVTLALANNPTGAILSGTLTQAAVAGVATFANISIDNFGAGYTLQATSAPLPAATSGAIGVAPPLGINTWTNLAGGNWSTAGNWSQGTVPVATDTVRVTLAGSYTVNLDVAATVARLEVGAATGTQTLQLNANNLTTSGSGTFTANGRLTVGGGTAQFGGAFNTSGIITVTAGAVQALNGGSLGNAIAITSPATVTLAGGSFSALGNTLNASGTGRVIMTGGSLAVAGATDTARFTTLELNGGTLVQTGVVRVATLLAWSGGTAITGSGKVLVPAGGTFTGTGSTGRTFTGGVIENGGAATFSTFFQINSGLGAVMRNMPGATFTLNGDAQFLDNQGAPAALFDNQGSFARTTSSNTVIWSAFYQDTVGTTAVSAGVFQLQGGGRFGGPAKSITGGVSVLIQTTAGTFTMLPGTSFTGVGRFALAGGTLTPDSASAANPVIFQNLTVANATVAHEGLIQVNGNLDWASGTISSNSAGLGGTTRIMGTGTFTMSGTTARTLVGSHTLDILGGTTYGATANINTGQGAVINNSGVWNWTSTGSIVSNQGGTPLQFNLPAAGTLRRSTNAATVVLDATINKQGPFDIQTGALQLNRGSVTNFGGTVTGAGFLDLAGGAFTQSANLTIAGSLDISGGSLSPNGFATGVGGNFRTLGTGALIMAAASDSVDITGTTTFGGGTSTLNAGVMRLAGNFVQTGTTTFQGQAQSAAVAHRVVLDGATGTQTLNFADPVSNFFRRLILQRGAGTSTVLQTNVRTTFFSMAGGTYSMTGVAGPPMARLIADTVAGASSGSVSMQSPLVLQVNVVLVDSNVINVDTVVFALGPHTILNTAPGGFGSYTYHSIRVNNPTLIATFGANLSLTNDLVVSGGRLAIGGRQISVGGNFRTEASGILEMSNAADSLGVAGNVTFTGAGTTGLLTNGRITLNGSLVQGGSTNSFAATGAHRVRFTGVAAQNITFANTAQSFFHRLEVAGNNRSVILQSDAVVNDSLTMFGGGGAANLVGAGTTQRLRVNGGIRVTQQTLSPLLAPPVLEVASTWNVDSIVAAGRGVSPDTFVLLPGVTNLADGTPMRFKSVRVATNAVVSYSTGGINDSIVGDLVVDGSSTFSITGGTLTAVKFRTINAGVLRMQTAGPQLIVADSAIFAGGSTTGQLTNGTTQFRGNFVQQGGSTSAFAPSGAHVTVFGSGATVTNSTISFANPTTSFFDSLVLNKSVGPTRGIVTFQTDALINGGLGIANATDVTGPTARITVAGGSLTASQSTFSPTMLTTRALELSVTPSALANMVGAVNISPDTVVINTGITTMPTASGLRYNSIRVNTGAALTMGPDTITGDLDIAAGTATFSAGLYQIGGRLRTRGTGALSMITGAGAPTITVTDSAVFGGGSAALSGGELRLLGHFNQTGTNTYQATATHTTTFAGNVAGGQRVSFAAPGTGAAQSRFANLFIGRPGSLAAGITLASNIFATGALRDTSTGPVDSILGGGFTVNSVNLQIGSNFVMNNAPLVLTNPTTITMLGGVPGLTFRNMNPTVTQFTLALPAGGGITMPGLNFATAPTTGLYLSFTAPSLRTVAVQNSTTAFALFTVANTLHTNVTVTWPPSGLPLP